ncbi:serine/threonine-protein kinase [Brachybacterium sp. YJGR34]|uniref:serine/threonine-protein kinase n=1 Tax=Brachybacterium sp. YJGR34 TaxID=2059911 RepID=UPI000E0B3FE3|nr:serine/threonine-protein kinase [Brachybacterium sp. YJGR34]
MTPIMSDVIAGRIELLDPLARGASGSLWRAIDRRYGVVCAAKVMRQRDGADVLRFVREQTVGSAQGLGRHPHLLPPYTWVAEDDTIVLVMPLVHGGTLAGAIAEHGALSPALTAQLLRQLLDALSAMHASHWVHRDVKPANLLLDSTGDGPPHLLLADFGIALHETDVRLTETGFVHGTPGFMAPELLEGAGTSFAQDVWAAGACALEALDPLPPRERPAPEELPDRASRTLAGSADPAAAGLEHLLRSLLDLDPARRPSAAGAREAIPRPEGPPAQWARTAAGTPFLVPDQVPSPDGLSEVPLEGPATLAGLAPGLHERLTALSSGGSAASPGPGTSPDPSDDATVPRSGPTEHLVAEETRRAPQEPAPTPAPTSPSQRTGRWIGMLLLVISLLSLLGAGALLWLALS